VRGATSTLLIALQLLSGLTFAHAHDVSAPHARQENQEPTGSGHFHVHFLPFGTSHDHDDDVYSGGRPDHGDPFGKSASSSCAHDENAVYGTLAYLVTAPAAPASPQSMAFFVSPMLAACHSLEAAAAVTDCGVPERRLGLAGGHCAHHPLYLATLHLLI